MTILQIIATKDSKILKGIIPFTDEIEGEYLLEKIINFMQLLYF